MRKMEKMKLSKMKAKLIKQKIAGGTTPTKYSNLLQIKVRNLSQLIQV